MGKEVDNKAETGNSRGGGGRGGWDVWRVRGGGRQESRDWRLTWWGWRGGVEDEWWWRGGGLDKKAETGD